MRCQECETNVCQIASFRYNGRLVALCPGCIDSSLKALIEAKRELEGRLRVETLQARARQHLIVRE